MIAGLAEPLIGLADTAILGNLAEGSTEAVGGVGIAVGLFFFVFWTFIVIHPTMVATVSRYLGEKRVEELDALVFQLVVFNAVLGLVLWVVTSTYAPELLGLYNAKGEVLRQATTYFRIRALGFPLMLMTFLMFGVLQGLQNLKWEMWIVLLGGSLNIVLDLLLVYGVEGLVPAMGVAGAAYGSLASQVVMFAVTLWLLLRHTPFSLKPVLRVDHRFRETLGVSGHFMVRTLTINTVFYLATSTAAKVDEHALAAHAMAMQVWTFSFFLLDGYSSVGQTMSGKLFGEGRTQDLRWLSGRLIRIGFAISGTMVLGYTLLYGFLGKWLSNDPLTQRAFEEMFWLLILTIPIAVLAFTYDGILKGLAEARFLMRMMLTALLLFAAVLWLQSPSIQSVWIGFLVWMGFRTLANAWYFNRSIPTHS